MQRVAWILGLLVASPAVVGAELFRCVDAAGGVTWQDAPCGAGSRLSKTLEVPEATESDGASGSSANAKGSKGKAKGAKSKRGGGVTRPGAPTAGRRSSPAPR